MITVFYYRRIVPLYVALTAWTRLHMRVYAGQQSLFLSLSDAKEILNDKMT